MPPMMTCPHCQSREISKRNGTTDLGYELLRCDTCCRKFNERTGTPFNHLEFPTDIVFQVVLCRLRYNCVCGIGLSCSCCAGSSLRMRRIASGKNDFLPC